MFGGSDVRIEEHRIQGIGYGFIRKIVEMRRLKRVCTVGSKEAVDMARSLCRKHGLTVGISSGANMIVALGVSKKWDKVVTVSPGRGKCYLIMDLFKYRRVCSRLEAGLRRASRLTKDLLYMGRRIGRRRCNAMSKF